ncbi:hypothetical protein BDB01DRAFT_780010 [Pilobolus umbonatus]|nr:hypothetical protein BDB01DRAFT_780010 [Pilobolus umbonatus]
MPNSQVIDEQINRHEEHKDLLRSVVISIDEDSAEYVYDWAMNNFVNPKTDLVILLNCRQIDAPIAPYINPSNFVEELDDRKKKKSHELLKKYAARIKAQDVAVRAIALLGDPKVEIVRKVTELKADVLLMGSRKLNAVKRALLGSVSDYVSHHSPTTTIIVRANPDHQEGKHEFTSLFRRRASLMS